MFSHAGAWRERVLAAEMNMQGLWCSQWCPRVCGAMAEWGKHFGNTPGHLLRAASNIDTLISVTSPLISGIPYATTVPCSSSLDHEFR
jgi:hypothetical protein